MNNLTLGKTLKAMYKLSGKTLTQLSDETGLTVDTINNLFYARIQKPGFSGVLALVDAMGFTLQQLMTFVEENPDIPEDCNVTDLFTKTIASAEDTITNVQSAKTIVDAAKIDIPAEIELLNLEHEKQLDRFRATHLRYVGQLQEQHDRQIEQMKAHNRNLEQHFDHSVTELKSLHEQEVRRIDEDNRRLRKTIRILGITIGIETCLIMLLLILDALDHGIGWFR